MAQFSLAELDRVKKKLQSIKEKGDELRAEKKVLLKRLEEEYGVKTIKEAQELLEETEEALEEGNEEQEDKFNVLKNDLKKENIL